MTRTPVLVDDYVLPPSGDTQPSGGDVLRPGGDLGPSGGDVRSAFNAILDEYSWRVDKQTNFILLCREETAAALLQEVSRKRGSRLGLQGAQGSSLLSNARRKLQ